MNGPNSASRNDNPEAWVSGGHEKFETPVIPIQDEEHPAAAKSRASADSGTVIDVEARDLRQGDDLFGAGVVTRALGAAP